MGSTVLIVENPVINEQPIWLCIDPN